MIHAALTQIDATPVNDQPGRQAIVWPQGGEHALTISDAVRRCRWMAQEINATSFAVFLAPLMQERARLVPCLDSDHPGAGFAKSVTGNIEHLVRHVRTSTEPLWWSEGPQSPAAQRLGALCWVTQIEPIIAGTSGIAFPVHAERNQCGLVVFAGPCTNIDQNLLFEVHSKCFSLFSEVTRLRPASASLTRAMTRRELECLKLTANGYTSEEIARILKLSVHTTNQYLTQSAQKLNAVSRTQAVAKALRLGLIE